MNLKEIEQGIRVYDSEFGSSNIVSISTKEGTVIVDSSLFPSKAEQIKVFIKQLLNSEISFVINTHYHPDHSFGNSGFKAPVLVSEKTDEFFRMMDKKYIDTVISKDEVLKNEKIDIVPPSITFDNSYNLKFGGLDIIIQKVGGHTEDSSVVKIPKYGLLISGDIIVDSYHPEIVKDSDLKQWIKVLKNLKKEKFKKIVCGHGGVVKESEIDNMKEYLEKLTLLNENRTDIQKYFNELEADPNFFNRKMSRMLLENLKIVMSH